MNGSIEKEYNLFDFLVNLFNYSDLLVFYKILNIF